MSILMVARYYVSLLVTCAEYPSPLAWNPAENSKHNFWPSPLVAPFYDCNVLVKALPMFVAHCPTVLRKNPAESAGMRRFKDILHPNLSETGARNSRGP